MLDTETYLQKNNWGKFQCYLRRIANILFLTLKNSTRQCESAKEF